MEGAHTEIVQGVTLEAISAADFPDTESLLGELGAVFPVVTYPADAPVEEPLGALEANHPTAERRDEPDASIMAGLLWP